MTPVQRFAQFQTYFLAFMLLVLAVVMVYKSM